MINKDNIDIMLSKMTIDTTSNFKQIRSMFGTLDYKDEEGQSILHILVDNLYDEERCFLAIQSLLKLGFNPNLVDDYKYNFIQTALYTGYSEQFILKIIDESLKYGLNVNHVDEDKDTIMHTAIYSDYYLGDIESIYQLLCDNGFDSTLTEINKKNLLETMIYMKETVNKYSVDQIKSFGIKFKDALGKILKDLTPNENGNFNTNDAKSNHVIENNNTTILNENDISELDKYGKVLNNKKYITSPTIGREKELKNLIITLAQERKNPLIVGESGVGKTSIVDELAYRIQTKQVPIFLQDKIILEVNPSDVVAGCRYVGQFEEKMTKLMKLCEKQNIIVFIDEIHTIYGTGSSKGNDNDMAAMLKHYIDRSNLKVIGTTTEKEYNEYFSGDALKRRFEKINVTEPEEDVLYQIIDKVINDYNLKNEIHFENENIREDIINIILFATNKHHRVYNDMINNPDLSISIIDKAYAFAKIYDSKFITSKHFAESFEYCDRLYDTAKEQAISSLKKLDIDTEKPKSKILKVDFNKFGTLSIF